MSDRVLNFLDKLDRSSDTMRQRFLTDAVPAGIQLDEVNAEWETAATAISSAIKRRGHAATQHIVGRRPQFGRRERAAGRLQM